MEETLLRMRRIDELLERIRLNVDHMDALADDEIASILYALTRFEERFRFETDYLRPDPEEE